MARKKENLFGLSNNKMSRLEYQPVIGLEIHVELLTKAKMFCRCSANHFQVEPNSHVCPVCLGLPGAMPYPNLKALEKTLLIARLLHCQINKISRFERKHYFYPDLPKGYQLTQYIYPMGYDGYLVIRGKKFKIQRVHQEEDTAKLKHQKIGDKLVSLVDFNRSGVPLVEMVTAPVFDNSQDVVEFLKKLQRILRFYEVSDCDMEKGSMRLEANISLRPKGQTELPNYKVELKNINSFRFLAEAINYEIKRQSKLLEKGQEVSQETRGYDSIRKRTFSQRKKEEAQDYHYLLEPDIPPIYLSDELVKKVYQEKEYDEIMRKWQNKGWPEEVLTILLTKKSQLGWWQKLEEVANNKSLNKKKLAHFLVKNKKRFYLKEVKDLVLAFEEDSRVFSNSNEIEKMVGEVLKKNPQAVKDYRQGKEAALYFLLGQVRYRLGKVDVKEVINLLKSKIKEDEIN